MTLEADRRADGLIQQVQKMLGKASRAAAFAPLLYGRKSLDGLERVQPERLADTVREAMAFLAGKPKGRHKVRIRRMAAGANGGRTCWWISRRSGPSLSRPCRTRTARRAASRPMTTG